MTTKTTKPESAAEEVGRRIRRYRKDRHMTLEQLAAAVGKGKATLSKYENGSIGVDVETLFTIAEALDMDARSLVDVHRHTRRSPKIPAGHYFNTPKIFMYYYDGRFQRLVRSLLFLSYSAEEERTEALLYNDFKDLRDYENCEDIYAGELIAYDMITYATLHNQVNDMFHMNLNILNPVHTSTPASGMMSAIGSFPFFSPVAFKALFSSKQLKENQELMNTLILSKEEHRENRELNMMITKRPGPLQLATVEED